MSYTDEYIREAIKSCKIYSDYCKSNEKSRIITKVSKISRGDTPRTFVLHLENRSSFHSFDSEAFCIKLDEEMMLAPSYYDDFSQQYIKHDYIDFLTYLHKEQQLIIKVKDDTLLPLFRDYLASHPERITFISDMTFLIDKVKAWYENHGSKVSLPLNSNDISVDLLSNDLMESLSDSQNQAVHTALSSPVSYIWGPPGTGKTWTLAHTVLALLRCNKKVLILAPTNNAIDNSLRTILHVMESKGESTDSVIRWGIPTVNFENEYSQVCDNSAISKMIDSYKRRIAECESLLESSREHDAFHSSVAAFREYKQSYVDTLDDIEKGENALSGHEAVCTEILGRLHAAKIYAQEASHVLDKYKQRGISLKHRMMMRTNSAYRDKYYQDLSNAQVKFDQRNKEVDSINTEYGQALDKKHRAKNHIVSLKAKAEDHLHQIESVSNKLLGSYVSIAVLEAEICLREEEYRNVKSREQIEADINYYKTQLADIDKLVEQQKTAKRIFACTIDYLYAHYDSFFDDSDPMMPSLTIDHVFIDEAALLPMIKAGIAFSLDAPVTMCGDHKQLPPVCEMNDPIIKQPENQPAFLWAQSALYYSDLFYHTMDELYSTYVSSGDILSTDMSISFLKDTFRFGDNLAKILDEYIYHNGFSGIADPTQIIILDAPHNEPTIVSRTSADEVEALKKYIQTNSLEDYVILTPYIKQRNLLRKELKPLIPSNKIQTVHAAQGLEWETVIISVVDAERPFFCNSGIAIGRNVLNTAISRSIKSIIIVCDHHYWVTKPRQLLGALANSSTLVL